MSKRDCVLLFMKDKGIPLTLENWIELSYWRPAAEVLAEADAEFWDEVPEKLLQVEQPKTQQ